MFLKARNFSDAIEYCFRSLPVPIHRPEQYMIEDYASLGKVFPDQSPLLLSQQRELVIIVCAETCLAMPDEI
jgi:hypothetical protein